MSKGIKNLPIEQILSELKEFYSYNKDTGIFIRIKSKKNVESHVGMIVGAKGSRGSLCIPFMGTNMQSAILAWIYTYEAYPKNSLFHINGNKEDNRICNLSEYEKIVLDTGEKLISTIKENFEYNAITGDIKRLKINVKNQHGIKEKENFLCNDGYIKIKLYGKLYPAHRVAWILYYGHIPKECIDHIDGNRLNNKFANLREANKAQNNQNRRNAQKNSNCKYLGVFFDKKRNKYVASIRVNKKLNHLGCFNCPIEAHEVYLRAKREFHEYCTI